MPSPETSRRNLEKAKENWREPRPWRTPKEAQLIRLLAWRRYKAYSEEGQRYPGRKLARELGVSHTHIQNLFKEFEVAEPRKLAWEDRYYGPATFEKLWRAQQDSRDQRALGWLRPLNTRVVRTPLVVERDPSRRLLRLLDGQSASG